MAEQGPMKKYGGAEREAEVLAFWHTNDIFKRTLHKRAPRGEFVFYDGPPFATGLPHYGHLLASTVKDVIPRFKTMRGFSVSRRWGWDCHGLPVEHEVEKELGFKTKKDIAAFGIEKFNARARETVMRYAADWRAYIARIGRFVDMDNDYRTMDPEYTESVWWVFKTLHERGLLYEGFKPMHLCPRCETTLSNFEVSQGYREIRDLSLYVVFPLLHPEFSNAYAVAWTTTPWTLPGNAALALHPEHEYTFVEITASNAPELKVGDRYLLGSSEEILRRVFGGEEFEFDPVARAGSFSRSGRRVAFSAKERMLGKKLLGLPYEPPFAYYSKNAALPNRDRGWRIVGGPFVSAAEGTGIVHIAPAFGEDDYNLALEEKLPFVQHISTDGVFKKEVVDFAWLPAKPKSNPRESDEKIAAFLAARGLLLAREDIVHPYPHCWRCETPLLNFAAPSWFVKVTELRRKLLEENKKIGWIPPEAGASRFGSWLAEAKDWAVSRSRFWGAPIPVWRCERCRALRSVGSLDELRLLTGERLTKVVLLRHGESVKNAAHVFDDSPERFHLTREGRREAKRSAERIKAMGGIDVIFTSSMLRAKETAALIGSRLRKSVAVEEDFREVDSGEWDGKREDAEALSGERAVYDALPLESYYRAKRGKSGESWEDVERRMGAALARVLAKHRGERVLIVSHEGPIVYLLRTLKGFSLEETDRAFRRTLFTSFAEPIVVYLDAETGKEVDLHRPHIDTMLLTCEHCARETGSGKDLMRRVPEVFDCWFESGAMPYAQAHYPFAQDGRFDPVGGWFAKTKGFPADFIAEGLDQTRGWFYSLLVLGVALFGKSPFRAAAVNGIILAEDGAKMSKRLKNYPDPLAIMERYGADALRYYLLSSPVVRGEELRFSERAVEEASQKVFHRLDNVLAFYLLYAGDLKTAARGRHPKSGNVLDEWIIARLNQLITETTEALERYEFDRAVRPIGEFVDDLSTWYLRRSRERMKSDILEEKQAALGTLWFTLLELSKVMAPFAPFFAEHLFQKLTADPPSSAEADYGRASPPSLLRSYGRASSSKPKAVTSVHLESWPGAANVQLTYLPVRQATYNSQLILEMREVRRIVSLALEQRAKAGVKVRQPLARLKIKNQRAKIGKEFIDLLKDEVNVKEVVFDDTISGEVELVTELTPELKDEGQFRELVRFVQEMRKRGGFKPGEPAALSVAGDEVGRRFLLQHEEELARIASLGTIAIVESIAPGESFRAEEIALQLGLRR